MTNSAKRQPSRLNRPGALYVCMYACMTRHVYVCKAKPWIWNSKFESDCVKFSPFWLQIQDFTPGTEKFFILLLLPPWTVQFAIKSIKNCCKAKGALKPMVTFSQSKWARPRDPDLSLHRRDIRETSGKLNAFLAGWLQQEQVKGSHGSLLCDRWDYCDTTGRRASALGRTLALPDRLAMHDLRYVKDQVAGNE